VSPEVIASDVKTSPIISYMTSSHG